MLAVIRLRGSIKMKNDIKDALKILNLKKINTMIMIDKNDSNIGMIRKVENFAAWGEINNDILNEIKNRYGDSKVIGMKPPKGGLKSIKKKFPKGNLGYCGENINELIKKML